MSDVTLTVAGPDRAARTRSGPATTALIVAALSLPLIGLVLLTAIPDLDVWWEHHPSHFWLVLGAAAINAVLAYTTGEAARRRSDARVFLVSLAFLSAAGFLALHALATPGVLLSEANAGFTIATPIGLLMAAGFVAASSAPLTAERSRAVMEHSALLLRGLLGLMVLWGLVSLTGAPPLDAETAPERASGPMVAIAVAGVALYAYAVVRYIGLYRRRPSTMLIGMVAAFTLLAEAMIAVAFGRDWHATWWEWHLLMLAAFVLVAWSARREWHEERYSHLYLDETLTSERDVSVLFADLQGFTSFSESHSPRDVTAMLNSLFDVAVPPVVERNGGRVDRIVGDALMAVFEGDEGGIAHAERAARAGLEIQQASERISREHPDWPRFRVGVNTGVVAVSILGTEGGRTSTAIGDTVNLAARLEGQAPVGGVALGPETARRLGDHAELEPLGGLRVKGKAEPVEAFRLVGLR